jgi:hypothetical protein
MKERKQVLHAVIHRPAIEARLRVLSRMWHGNCVGK